MSTDFSAEDSLSEEIPMRPEIQESGTTKPSSWKNFHIDRVEITSFTRVDKTINSFITYRLISQILHSPADGSGSSTSANETETHTVNRRYNQFLWLHKNLCEAPGVFLPFFPDKDFFNSNSESLITFRKASFSAYLQSLLRNTDKSVFYPILLPFLTMEDEAFAIYIKENPAPVVKLPAAAAKRGIFSWFSGGAKPAKLNVAPLARLYKRLSCVLPSSDKQNQESLDFKKNSENEEELIEQVGALANEYSGAQNNMMEHLQSALEKLDDAAGDLDELRAATHEVADLHVKAEDPTDRELGQVIMKCESTFTISQNLLEGMLQGYVDLQASTQQFNSSFAEIDRLAKQNTKLKADLNNAEMLINEYKANKLAESTLAGKNELEAGIKKLKEFKKLRETGLEIFKVNFAMGFEKFRKSRAPTYKEMVNKFMDRVRAETVKMEESLRKVENREE